MSEVPATQTGGLDQASHLVNFVIFKLYLNKVFFFLRQLGRESHRGNKTGVHGRYDEGRRYY